MLAFREAPVAVVMEGVPIARVVFVVRLPALDKESEAELTTSVLLPSKDWMLSRSGLRRRVTASQTGPFALALFWGSNGLARKEGQPGIPRGNHRWAYPWRRGFADKAETKV